MKELEIKVHLNPIWRDKADFIIRAKCGDVNQGYFWEQLWARQLGENRFMLCCIPFFAYDLSLGDEVETTTGQEMEYVISRVVKRSCHYTFRVWFENLDNAEIRNKAFEVLKGLGCLIECHSDKLVGVSIDSETLAQQVSGYLLERENAGDLSYETGRTK